MNPFNAPMRRHTIRSFGSERSGTGGEHATLGVMHEWDESTDLLAQSVLGYAVERLKVEKDTRWGARPAAELASALAGAISPKGIGGHRALVLFRDVLMHACRPIDDPNNLAYVPTAPTPAANLI